MSSRCEEKLKHAWDDQFKDFDLDTAKKRDRRSLFKAGLMSGVADPADVQSDGAYCLTHSWVLVRALAQPLFNEIKPTFSEREKKLFELRYGNCGALGENQHWLSL